MSTPSIVSFSLVSYTIDHDYLDEPIQHQVALTEEQQKKLEEDEQYETEARKTAVYFTYGSSVPFTGTVDEAKALNANNKTYHHPNWTHNNTISDVLLSNIRKLSNREIFNFSNRSHNRTQNLSKLFLKLFVHNQL